MKLMIIRNPALRTLAGFGIIAAVALLGMPIFYLGFLEGKGLFGIFCTLFDMLAIIYLAIIIGLFCIAVMYAFHGLYLGVKELGDKLFGL